MARTSFLRAGRICSVLVDVDEGAQALVGEDLAEQALVERAVDEVDAGHAGLAGRGGVRGLGELARGEAIGVVVDERPQLAGQHLANQLAAMNEAVLHRHEDELERLQPLGDRHRDAVGVQPVGAPFAVEPEWRDDRHHALRQQRAQELGVDPLDLPGEEMVDAEQDAERVGGDDVGAGGAEVVGREALEDFVGQPGRRGHRQVERDRVGHPGAVEVRGRGPALGGQRLDLLAGAVHQHDPDVDRQQQGDVEQQRREVLVGDDGAVEREHEGLVAELEDVLEDAAQFGQLHRPSMVRETAGCGTMRR